ncbi:MAG: hypothetical protein HY559_00720 [Gammaproteobacteria bacterium]|nr:hypothetical protein [Gammaproteobacteria bacterium]
MSMRLKIVIVLGVAASFFGMGSWAEETIASTLARKESCTIETIGKEVEGKCDALQPFEEVRNFKNRRDKDGYWVDVNTYLFRYDVGEYRKKNLPTATLKVLLEKESVWGMEGTYKARAEVNMFTYGKNNQLVQRRQQFKPINIREDNELTPPSLQIGEGVRQHDKKDNPTGNTFDVYTLEVRVTVSSNWNKAPKPILYVRF